MLTGAILAITVNPNWAFLCAFFGAGLTLSGSTGWCGLAILMSKMPRTRVASQACGTSGNCSTSNLTQPNVPQTNHRLFPRPKSDPDTLGESSELKP